MKVAQKFPSVHVCASGLQASSSAEIATLKQQLADSIFRVQELEVSPLQPTPSSYSLAGFLSNEVGPWQLGKHTSTPILNPGLSACTLLP